MSSRSATRFDEQVWQLLRAYIYPLKKRVWPSVGRPPACDKEVVDRALSVIDGTVKSTLLASKRVRDLLGTDYDEKKQWHVSKGKGRGKDEKKKNFRKWYSKNIAVKNCVYAFWQDKKCLYVGRTLNSRGTRPSDHFEKNWFKKTTRIDVYKFERRRDVPRFECLLSHEFEPHEYQRAPAKKKYYSICPICEGSKLIRRRLKKMFKLR